jgi:hypothetical protein
VSQNQKLKKKINQKEWQVGTSSNSAFLPLTIVEVMLWSSTYCINEAYGCCVIVNILQQELTFNPHTPTNVPSSITAGNIRLGLQLHKYQESSCH